MTPQEQDMMARFRQDYLDLLEGRVDRIRELVGDHQVEAANVALLSLESSSAMVGAAGLVASVRALRSGLERGQAEQLPVLTEQMVHEAHRARSVLVGGAG